MFGTHLFPGGTHPHEGPGGKKVNEGNQITDVTAPFRVIIPLSQHIGAPAKAVVKKDDHVLVGQVIGEAGGFVSAPVHATVSGRVEAVRPCMLANGTSCDAVVIENDFKDEWIELHPTDHAETLTADELREIIRNAGIVGMGGATFPTMVKLNPGEGKTIEKLIINGAECEPYLTADHRLMLEEAGRIIDGIHIVMTALNVTEAVIGVENNKKDAIAALQDACRGMDGIHVKELPVRYPQGGEKQLIYAITKRVVPAGGLPLDVGVVVMNVGTVFAVDQAVREGRPLVDRVTTVGGLVNNPGNYRVRIGTPISLLLDACGGVKAETKKILSGGPMMGLAINDLEVPITKGSSGILALGKEAIEPDEGPCIRCGRCVRTCPMKLMPSSMDAYIRKERYEDAEKLGVMNCISCGACTYVCPAKRMLTQSFQSCKRVINLRKKQAAARAKADAEAVAAQQTAANESANDAKKEG
ncbi:MAG: electron transport complex subunit RsxC [Clostridia bacterium]|nr:electron transport complex subunit RsxC [Clostridia bacterium]